MPEIGATLREARMRASIDISEIELVTKIRAKYLRALENEEWDLLPGPTYVKSFLRTYADALDLDAKLLVEEYKARHERLSDVELQPISPRSGRERRRSGPIVPRGVIIALVFAGLLVALYVLGSGNGDGGGQTSGGPDSQITFPPPDSGERSSSSSSDSAGAAGGSGSPGRPRRVRLQIVATGPVYVCLTAGSRTLVDGRTLAAGQRTDVFRSRRFRLRLGNNSVRLRINGRSRAVAPSSGVIGLEITPSRGRQPLGADELPGCA